MQWLVPHRLPQGLALTVLVNFSRCQSVLMQKGQGVDIFQLSLTWKLSHPIPVRIYPLRNSLLRIPSFIHHLSFALSTQEGPMTPSMLIRLSLTAK